MRLPFDLEEKKLDRVDNYDLHFLPNGVYRTSKIEVPNYLYPMYAYRDGEDYLVSTSVYALICHKKRFVRNPRFHTTNFYRPSFLTPDLEIQRARTPFRTSTRELKDPEKIIQLGVDLMQESVTEMEEKYPDYTHVVSMGGKDSQNIVLAKRKSPWIVLSGEPNAPINRKFIEDNQIEIEEFVSVSNETDDSILLAEIMASDCFFDVAHLRWANCLRKIVEKKQGKVVFWMGSSGDGIFSKNHNHRDKDYFALHDLHVGMAMGIMHQMFKNLFHIPAVSPYQTPKFLDELFYRFDPYYVLSAGDVRAEMGRRLFGRDVIYPSANPTPDPWKRNRHRSLPRYIRQLKRDGISCQLNRTPSLLRNARERTWYYFNLHSIKRRGKVSRVLHPLRNQMAKVFPRLENTRHNIRADEIR